MPDASTVHRLLSGESRGLVPSVARGALSLAEIPYAAAMRLRNRLYDAGVFRAHRAGVRVISVGNLTAGGTGKTPMIRFLAGELSAQQISVGILLRGYKSSAGASDEQLLLQNALAPLSIPVLANPDRVAGARQLLAKHPAVGLILLDDAFQHRRIARDADVVLIDAAEPFGYGHVHPRGLLREPLAGLARADAFVITRADRVAAAKLESLRETLRGCSPRAPIYRCRHVLAGLRPADAPAHGPPPLTLDVLDNRRTFALAAIANPAALLGQLDQLPGRRSGQRLFGDHHAYSDADARGAVEDARRAGADTILVTEKDWVKLADLPAVRQSPIVFYRLDLKLEFEAQGARGLVDYLLARLDHASLPATTDDISAPDSGPTPAP